jgi:hypothetical protein
MVYSIHLLPIFKQLLFCLSLFIYLCEFNRDTDPRTPNTTVYTQIVFSLCRFQQKQYLYKPLQLFL